MTGLRLPEQKVAGIVSISGIADIEADFSAHAAIFFWGESGVFFEKAGEVKFIAETKFKRYLPHSKILQVNIFYQQKEETQEKTLILMNCWILMEK